MTKITNTHTQTYKMERTVSVNQIKITTFNININKFKFMDNLSLCNTILCVKCVHVSVGHVVDFL